MQTQSDPPEPAQTRPRAAGAFVLGGGLRSPGLADRFGRPMLCLPQDPDRCIFDVWNTAFTSVGLGDESVIVLTDDEGERNWKRAGWSPRLLVDSAAYRGPAGVLRDASVSLEAPGPRIVIEHSRLLASPEIFGPMLDAHEAGGPTITIATNPDGSFSGILIADAEAIEIVPSIGFMDIKEQWIPAAQADGCVVRCIALDGWSYPIRSLDTYLGALDGIGAFGTHQSARVIGRSARGVTPTEYGGSLIATGAEVESSVAAARSVISAGAQIGEGAIILRSVVGPGARVPKEGVVVDSIVRAADD